MMINHNKNPDEGQNNKQDQVQIKAPTLQLPKGGGAIRGLGEKFSANPVTGTGSMTIPIATSSGRAGFGPQLSLSYDSGAGNGPFGFGWSLSLPAITRKTDKGLPKYLDSDVFILSGAEDLVPEFEKDAAGNWIFENGRHKFADKPRTVGDTTYTVRRYRPRIEGLFARIERWTNQTNPADVFWRSISRDNITTWYGKSAGSRIADPADTTRVFSWLICESHDDKGNVMVYSYIPENSVNIDDPDNPKIHERNRSDATRSAQRYLKSICYGNRTPYRPGLTETAWPTPPGSAYPDVHANWFFQIVFDYGEHDDRAPLPNDHVQNHWPCRSDPFSTYRPGFEVRTYRLCQRVLMFHHFPQKEIGADCLVRSTDFTYCYEQDPDDPRNPIYSFLVSVSQNGYKHHDSSYLKRSLPPLEFSYQEVTLREVVETVDAESLENLPSGLGGGRGQWVDLDGTGLSGILCEQSEGWYYKRNLSPAVISKEPNRQTPVACFSPVERIPRQPSLSDIGNGRQQFLDLAGDGQLDLVNFNSPVAGFYECAPEQEQTQKRTQGWADFKSFPSMPNIAWDDPNLRFVDLTGDGHADIIITQDEVITWYPSLGEDGFGPAASICQALDEEKGPRALFADATQSIQLADLSGDGLSDLVRIRNGEVCYWPNLGYGRFGARVTMDHAPWFDAPDLFGQKRIRLADIDGSGTTDILYLGRDGVQIYYNQSGNGWSDARLLTSFPAIDNLSAVQALDLLGNGTACLVWSSPLPGDASRAMRYIDLMGGQKPHLLIGVKNNLGASTEVQYAPSTKFYLADQQAGRPWATRLPFPVHCVEKVTAKDSWRETAFTTRYSYHHGYFDGPEREFRGFGRVEQIDIETYGEFLKGNSASPYIDDDQTLYQPPVKTVTWYHTGAYMDQERILDHFVDEYFPRCLDDQGYALDLEYPFAERALPEPDLIGLKLSAGELREALRACKGMTLRQEIYELDVDALETGQQVPVKLFSAAGHNCRIQCLQPRGLSPHAVFLVTEAEALTYHYELDLRQKLLRPDPRIAHSLTLSTTAEGQPQQVVTVGYPRVRPFEPTAQDNLPDGCPELIRAVQKELHLGYTETHYTHTVASDDHYRLQVPCEVFTCELTGIRPPDADPGDDIYFTLDELRAYRLSEKYQAQGLTVADTPYHRPGDQQIPGKRIVERVRTLFFDDNLVEPMSLGALNHLGLPYETYTLALTNDLVDAVLKEKLETLQQDGEAYEATVERVLRSGGYHPWDGLWWARSGVAGFADDAADHFYLPERYTDPFGQVTELTYDENDLYVRQSKDPMGNVTSVQTFDYRILAPAEIKDPNNNMSAVAFDALGLPVAAAIMGKDGTESGDNLDGLDTDPEPADLISFFTGQAYDQHQAVAWLGRATTRFVYYLGEETAGGSISYGQHPACACGILREQHAGQSPDSPIRTAFEYSDGTGQVLATKSQADPETEGGPLRWIVGGRTILNNKGKPVKQYEPYFSKSAHRYVPPEEIGVTPVMYYDAPGRLIRTEQPDGAYSRVDFSPWFTAAFDFNDTVLEPGNAWYAQNTSASASEAARRAARLAAQHADTPTVTHLDSLGREVVAVAHNRTPDNSGNWIDEKYLTFTRLDAEGKPLWIRDARGNRVMQYINPPIPDGRPDPPLNSVVPCYDIAGNLLYQHSMDAGDRWMLNDVTGQPLYSWDSRGHTLRTTYDPLRRPKKLELINSPHADWIVVGYTRYGDEPNIAEATSRNLLGQAYRSFDQSGLLASQRFDFKGNPLEAHRRLALAYTGDIDWRAVETLDPDLEPNDLLMAEAFTQTTEYDALNRVTRQYVWHKGVGSRVNVVEPHYNERGLLQKEDLLLEALKTEEGAENGASTQVVKALQYNEKGQRESITYGNNVTTTYEYDDNTFRLIHLQTQRASDGKRLQDLHYTYDPSGNITETADNAQLTVFFNNFQVDAKNRYTYDALYRLIEARGREHAGQVIHDVHDNWHDCYFRKKLHPNDAMAWQNYTERYAYDAVGNILSMKHATPGSNANNWIRYYQYARFSNRLLATGMGDVPADTYVDTPTLEYQYPYNTHGSMTAMPHLSIMEWNFTEHLHHIKRTAGTINPEETACPDASVEAWYRYDAAKQRTRKRVVKNQGSMVEERFYLGGIEIFRRSDGVGNIQLERETLHVMDDKQRIGLIETKALDIEAPPSTQKPLMRYQFGNHLGSVGLELNEVGDVISYEEYYPYGSTSYQATRKGIEVSLKRYRYTGMERDEESGLNYHGARYYAVWFGRWAIVDPISIFDGLNIYCYTQNNPIKFHDLSGTENKPATRQDSIVMQMNDNQLYNYLRKLSDADRNNFLRGTSGAFSNRAWAMANRYSMNIEQRFNPDTITSSADKPLDTTYPETNTNNPTTNEANDPSIVKNRSMATTLSPQYLSGEKEGVDIVVAGLLDAPELLFRTPDVVDFKDIPSMVDAIIKYKGEKRCISSLEIIGHGVPGTQNIGIPFLESDSGELIYPKNAISVATVPEFDIPLDSRSEDIRADLMRLSSNFCEKSVVYLKGCRVGRDNIGSNLLKRLSTILNVRVEASAGETNEFPALPLPKKIAYPPKGSNESYLIEIPGITR